MQKDHQPETADGLAYLWCIVGNCLTLFPTFLRCCFILRPQFGQIRLLAPIAPPFNIEIQLARKLIQIKTCKAA